MKLAILGGGGFRVPQVFEAIATEDAPVKIDHLALYDTDQSRLDAIERVLAQLPTRRNRALRVTASTNLATVVDGADFVFCAIRVGGTRGRTIDERVALDLGVLGQETIGPGGVAYTLRTVPVMMAIAEKVRRLAPRAWFINFTNPAGAVTEALRRVLGDRVVGICDTPIGLLRRATRAVGGVEPATFDYVGLNHLGWLRSFEVDGRDRLPGLLADDEALANIEEARLMGFDWVRALGALPNEYLFYYYFDREAVARIRADNATRGEFLVAQQARFYDEVGRHPANAAELWRSAKAHREATYMAESRPVDDAAARDPEDSGGYQQVALDLMAALATGATETMILNVANQGQGGPLIACLPPEAVVEVPCKVDSAGVHPRAVGPLNGHMAGLIQSVKAVEQLAIEAALTASRTLAWKALATHPLVDSVQVARQLLDGYAASHPQLSALR
ncbi:MAG: 6-phospho-beta-glucosidase [Bifidobacteriaceae bacterium]|jgi:6-phospho-beta-glucosidase|nr:6-phospho-beta-glucosidase [Bifidobacteriaceae bacterium]